MKRKTAVYTALLLALSILLASCSSGASDAARPENRSNESGLYFGRSDDTDQMGGDPSLLTGNTQNRVIIWTAHMDIEADHAVSAHGLLTARAAALGGWEHTNEVRHFERYSVVSASYKIPPALLDDFMAFAGDTGKVVNSRKNSDDITENYTDTQLRLQSARDSLEQYRRFMDATSSFDDVLRLQRLIDDITAEIEAFEGKLRLWSSLSEMATVTVLIRQENDPLRIRREIRWNSLSFGDMGYLIRSGFVAVSSTAFTILQWVVVAVLITSPLWIIVLVTIFIVIKRRKKRRAAIDAEIYVPDGPDHDQSGSV
jgi:hypothetical protein